MALQSRVDKIAGSILSTVAQARQIDLSAVAQTAVTEWLERESRLAQARLLMRELGAGLGAGQAHHASRKHDEYLYGLHLVCRDA